METLQLWPYGAEALNDGATDGYVPVIEYYESTVAPADPSRPRPAMVIYPGGSYHHRAVHEGKDIAEYYNTHGFNCFVVQYRVTPHYYPAPTQDGLRAIQFVRANAQRFGIDPEQIATIGFSAGGHLCASVGTLFDDETIDTSCGDSGDKVSRRPNAIGLAYPVISGGAFANTGSFKCLLGPQYPALCQQLSLETRVTDNTPPAFIWTTARDLAVPPQNSLLFAEAMYSHNLLCSLHIFPVGDHGKGLAPELPEASQWAEMYVTFLRVSANFNC